MQVYSRIDKHFKCVHVLCLLQTPQQIIVCFVYSTFSLRCFFLVLIPCDFPHMSYATTFFTKYIGRRRCQEKSIVYRVQLRLRMLVKPNHGQAIPCACPLVRITRSWRHFKTSDMSSNTDSG